MSFVKDLSLTLKGEAFALKRAYRMGLAQLVGELAVAIIIVAILFGGIAGGIFFQANTTGWDTTSKLVWPYIFPIALTAILMGIIAHMYSGIKGE